MQHIRICCTCTAFVEYATLVRRLVECPETGGAEIGETQLVRLLAAADPRPDALTAFRIARRWFIAGRRIEMRELAAELDVNRATLFRWVGSRDALLAEIVWSLAKPTWETSVAGTAGHGGVRVAAVLGRFATLVDGADYFRDFLRREPERAMRVVMTRAGTVQGRMVDAVETLLKDEGIVSQLPSHDLAYVIVRIVESFLYADIITGEQPDTAKVEQAIGALLVH